MAQPEPAGSLSGGDVPDLFVAGYSAKQIAPVVGLCVRRVRQLIAAAGLRPSPKPVPSPSLLEQILTSEVARHGGSYGYGMLSGVLAARYPQFRFPRRRVLAALQRLFPHAAARRYEWTAQRLERGRYFAPYFAYSWHLDYACKLQDYNIYVGAVIDGCSRTCVALKAVNDKLAVTAYDAVLLPALTEYGVPDQLNTDKGREWDVSAFAMLLLGVRCPFRANRRLQLPAGRELRRTHRYVFSKRNVRCHAVNLVPAHATLQTS